MKKKILVLLLAAVMVLSFAACGGGSSDGGSADDTMKVAMITDYGDITDQSFNQTTYEACKAFCEANSVEFIYKKPATDATLSIYPLFFATKSCKNSFVST